MAASVNTCAVRYCSKDTLSLVIFKWNWGENDLLIVDQHAHLGVNTSKDRSWATQETKVLPKGKSHFEKIDAVLADSHLDTRITVCILTNVIVPRRECAEEIWEVDAEFVKQVERVQMAAAEKAVQYVFKVHD